MLQHLSRAHTFLSPRPHFTTFTSTGVDYTYELHREISPPRNGVINAPTLLLFPSLDIFALYFSLLFSVSFPLHSLAIDDGKYVVFFSDSSRNSCSRGEIFTSTGVDYTYELHYEISWSYQRSNSSSSSLRHLCSLFFSSLLFSFSFPLHSLTVDDGKTAPYGKIPKNTWYFFPILLEIRVVAARF